MPTSPVLKPVESSNVHSVGYDRETRTLHVRFRSGGHYTYEGVHPNTFHGMLRSKSKGKYFHKRVRGRFDFQKQAERTPEQQKAFRRKVMIGAGVGALALGAGYMGLRNRKMTVTGKAVHAQAWDGLGHDYHLIDGVRHNEIYGAAGTEVADPVVKVWEHYRSGAAGAKKVRDGMFRPYTDRAGNPLNVRKMKGGKGYFVERHSGALRDVANRQMGAITYLKTKGGRPTQKQVHEYVNELDDIMRRGHGRPGYEKVAAREFYHGSPKRIETLFPRPGKGSSKFQCLNAVFVSDDKDHAKLYAVGKTAKGKYPFGILHTKNGPRLLTVEGARFGPGYLHTVTSTRHAVGHGPSEKGTFAIPRPVTPVRIETVHPREIDHLIERYKSKEALNAAFFRHEKTGRSEARPAERVRAVALAGYYGVLPSAAYEEANHYAGQTGYLGHLAFNAGYAKRWAMGQETDEDLDFERTVNRRVHHPLNRAKTASKKKGPHLTTTLEDHQARVRERMKRQNGLVVAHDMGSGKTLTSIAVLADQAAAHPGGHTLVVPPASLLTNYRKELAKHTGGSVSPGRLVSQQKLTLEGAPEGHHTLAIVDEAHRARSVGSKLKQTLQGVQADKRMLMTGTPVYNHPFEIAPLVNLAAGHHVLPETQADFERKYIDTHHRYPKGLRGLVYRAKGGTPGVTQTLKQHPELMTALEEHVDYHKPADSGKDFPDVTTHEHRVPMSEAQQERYDYMLGKLPPKLRAKIQEDLPPNKVEAQKLIAFLGGPRQVSTSVHGFSEGTSALEAAHDSPKIQAILKKVRDHPNEKHLIYSNYLDSAVTPISAGLRHAGVSHGRYTGVDTKKDRDRDIQHFNEGKHNVLLVSSAGGEGLDLKGVRHVHITEPHWNEQKLNQVIARARRYQSHAGLPEEQRNVRVHRYLSQSPNPGVANHVRKFFGRDQKMHDTAESYIQHRAEEKNELGEQMNRMMQAQTQKVMDKMHAEVDAGPQGKVMDALHADIAKGPRPMRSVV